MGKRRAAAGTVFSGGRGARKNIDLEQARDIVPRGTTIRGDVFNDGRRAVERRGAGPPCETRSPQGFQGGLSRPQGGPHPPPLARGGLPLSCPPQSRAARQPGRSSVGWRRSARARTRLGVVKNRFALVGNRFALGKNRFAPFESFRAREKSFRACFERLRAGHKSFRAWNKSFRACAIPVPRPSDRTSTAVSTTATPAPRRRAPRARGARGGAGRRMPRAGTSDT